MMRWTVKLRLWMMTPRNCVITWSRRGEQGFQVFLTRIKMTFEINKYFTPHFWTMGWVQMKLGKECDSSTCQPPLLNTVSRCQFTPACAALTLSLVHWRIMIFFNQITTEDFTECLQGSIVSTLRLIIFFLPPLSQLWYALVTLAQSNPAFSTSSPGLVLEDPQGVCGLIRVRQIGGKHRC